MRALIANKLTYIWNEVRRELENNKGSTAENSLLEQRLYILKHYPTYLSEYYFLLKEIVSASFLKEPYELLSFSSKCAIDYDAFFANASEENISCFHYTGVEADLWGDHNGVPPNHLTWVWSHLKELTSLEFDNKNLILLPKSLKHLSYQDFEALKKLIQMGKLDRRRICIAFSADDPLSPDFELNRLNAITQTIERWHKYKTVKESVVSFSKKRRPSVYLSAKAP
jgi:hypothetical protein